MLLPEGGKDQPAPTAAPSASVRVPPRGISGQTSGLETVVEGSVPTTPSIDPQPDPMNGSHLEAPNADPRNGHSSTSNSTILNAEPKEGDKTSRPSSTKADSESKSRAPSTSRPSSILAKRSFTSLTGKKNSAEPQRSMTVEPDPVPAPTSGLADRARDSGSVRTRTSTETIRPKKEKKKPARKPLNPGGASKADVFEAKVASAVDEADSSDSDETFVYESNPPDTRSHRHHSRTPSATSLASTNDHFRQNRHGLRSGSAAVPGKKSMKFGNSLHARENDDDLARGGPRSSSSTPRHHHIGRYGRNTHHLSLFDNDSPFGQTRQSNSPRNATGTFRNSRPNSPRTANGKIASPRKYGGSAYDNNEDIADDERAPLMGTVRTRNRHSKRPHSRDLRALEMGEDYEPSCGSRCTGCALLIFVLIVICSGLGLFAMAVNRPLMDVEIRKITNVLASEQELMLDLDVLAVNPNLFAVTVSDLDINLFAQSPYVGTSMDWQSEHPGEEMPVDPSELQKRGWFWPDPAQPNDGVDEGTDPDDPEGAQKMLLGRVEQFDSPLTFEPTPLRRNPISSVGEIRLSKPGNKTEVGGSDRWERVLQHDFDLIVRGVIKYQLPLSSKMRSAKIGSRKTVHPDSGDKDKHAED